MKKKIIAVCFTVLAMVMISAAASAAGDDADVSLDGSILDVKAQVSGQSVYLPVRAVCEALGYTVSWSDDSGIKSATVSKAGDTVTLDLTNQEITDNGHKYSSGTYSGKGIDVIASRTYIDSGLLSTIFAVRSSYSTQNNQVTLKRLCENDMTVTTEKIISAKDHLKTTIQYPQISGLADANVQKNMNAILKQSAQNALSAGQKNADDMAKAIKDGYTGAVGMCETYYDYVITYNQNGLFSVVLTDYQYAGGAHGGTVQSAYTFGLATGNALQLSDLMDNTGDYIEYIDNAIRKEIDRRVADGDLSEFDFSKFKDIGANPEFYLSNDAVVFYFQQYAYFPYASGIQEFGVKYSDLGSMLNKEFKFLYSAPVTLDPKVKNTLSVGDIAQVVLNGNASTGYSWHYTVSGGDVLSLTSQCYNSSAKTGIAGAGGTYTWNFKTLKAGDTAITFKYYREWEDESSVTPENTVVYKIAVS